MLPISVLEKAASFDMPVVLTGDFNFPKGSDLYKQLVAGEFTDVSAIAEKAEISKADAKKAVDAFVSTVTDALKEGDKIALVGFGTFSVSQKAARKGVNPATGATIEIAAKNVAKFKPGAELAEAVK